MKWTKGKEQKKKNWCECFCTQNVEICHPYVVGYLIKMQLTYTWYVNCKSTYVTYRV